MQKQIYTLVVDFSIQGDSAYLSHQETLKMFQRALIRASIPLAFSMGFNPHPRLSIPFPRSVGTQSIRDRVRAMVEFSENDSKQDWLSRIQEQLPSDCSVLEVQSYPGKYMFHPQGVRYIFRLESPFDEQFRDHLNNCRKQVDEKEPIEIQRYWAKKRRYKQFDLSLYLEALDFTNDQIEVVCGVSQSGTVRVDELMQWLNIAPDQFVEPVCRTEIKWCQN
ncbi:MAG: TIGR03936 family radical SAM-associated protein [Holophagae bacterium]|nr:TIGR03936 family radical SAM-associated protein [Holophagae bacterium]